MELVGMIEDGQKRHGFVSLDLERDAKDSTCVSLLLVYEDETTLND
jgi:hypothetical protein